MVIEPRSMYTPSPSERAYRAVPRAFAYALFALGLFAAPVSAADPPKTLRVVLTSAEMSFAPQFSADAGSDGMIAVADDVRAKALKSGTFDYDAPIPGLEAVDRYTLRIRLNAPDLRFLYVFAVPNTAAVAREVVEAYGRDFGAHPVGTGPYMLGDYQRSARIE